MWRERLHTAEKKYGDASAEYRRVQEICKSGSMPSADSIYALQQALRVENEARAEYIRVLQAFTRLVLTQEPSENEKRRA